MRKNHQMKKIRRTFIWLSLILLLPGIGVLTSCSDNNKKNETNNRKHVQTENLSQSRSMRGIQPVSKSAAKVHQKRLAMVIGNSDYDKSKLKNPVNDARSMARLLRRLDFDVDLVENGSRRDMIKEMNAFGRKLSQVDVGLFYYAGHGIGTEYTFDLFEHNHRIGQHRIDRVTSQVLQTAFYSLAELTHTYTQN